MRRACVVALAPLLAGCFVGMDVPETALDVPPRYENAPRRHDVALPSVIWWRGFRSTELTNLVEESLTSNLDIAAAVARVVQADAQARIAGAALLPVVDLDGSVARSQSPGQGHHTTYNASLSAAYEIDFWGKNRAALRSAEQLAAGSRFDRETVAVTVVSAVANSYFQLLAAQDRLRAARENLDAANRVFNLIKERLNVGTASALDVAQQESIVATQRAAIPLLEQVVRESKITLAVLLGRAPASVRVRGGSMNAVAIPPVTPGLPSDLLVQRPDIRSAEAQLEAANANVHAARAAMFPSIQLTGSGGYTSEALRLLLRPESAFFNLAAGLTQPIFDGLRLQGQLDLSKGRQDELLQIYRGAVVNAFGDVERALVAVRLTAERESLQRNVVTSSRRAFEISETRLREGAVDLITVLNTQQSLFQAQDALAQARLARLQAVVSLFQALGGGWPLPERAPPRREANAAR
jgi:outer membrane protein, multidrug efflux system